MEVNSRFNQIFKEELENQLIVHYDLDKDKALVINDILFIANYAMLRWKEEQKIDGEEE